MASGNFAVGGVLLLGIAGVYMALTARIAHASWIDVATISFVLLAPFGAGVLDPRVRALAKAAAAAPDGPLPDSLAARARDPILGIGLHLYIAALLGIVFLMTTKPELLASILVIVIAAALGLVSALPLWWKGRSSTQKKRELAG